MRIFHWECKLGNENGECIADGYLLATDLKDAENKLKFVPYHDKHEHVYLDTDDCGVDGCEIDENGIAIRWED